MARRRHSEDVQRVEVTLPRGARRVALWIVFGPFLFVVVLLTASEVFAPPGESRTGIEERAR